MVTISLVMITKNEEKSLETCLNSVKDLVDEINIVNTGSTDKTKEIARKFTERIFDFKWIDDFAAARNEAFSKATGDFILWLDADDILLAADQENFKHLKQHLDPSVDAVSMFYNTGINERGEVTFSFRRNRLVNRKRGFRWYGRVHEYLAVGGKIITSSISVTHRGKGHADSNRNLKIYEKMISDGLSFTPRDLFYYANECYDHGLHATAIDYYKKFLQTKKGWSEDCINACAKLATLYEDEGKQEQAIHYSLESFKYDIPRAEHCCRLGAIYLQNHELEKAIFWYKLAAGSDIDYAKSKGGFVEHSYYTWLPQVQLCVCYDQLKDYAKAKEHHEKAKAFDPQNSYVLYNEKYFNSIKGLKTASND
ncbi:MAG: glycosyltransferase family 2 protein [Sporolactobacillus sp.]